MRNIYILIILLMFIVHKDACILGSSEALVFWSKSLFPILFPTFIIVDLILSTNLIKYISNFVGRIFSILFKTSKFSSFIFIISMLCGTPTNAKILKRMYDEEYINTNELNKMLSFSILFNPFLIISFAGVKVLFIIWFSNFITGIILRNKYTSISCDFKYNPIKFNLGDSITSNMNIILNILGTVTVFMTLSYALPFINPIFNVISSSILELSTALYKNKLYLNSEYLYLIMLSFGGLSIFMQIKSILKDTLIDYKFLIKSRIITILLSLIICCLT